MQPATPPTHLQATLVIDGQTAPQIDHGDVFSKGHEWHFSIGIPGSIAETAYCDTHFVAYELVAEAKIPGLFSTSAQSKAHPIAIKRTPSADSSWTIAASEPFFESAVWRDRLELTVLCNSHLFHDQQSIAVRGILKPSEKGISLVRAGFQITERLSYVPNNLGWSAVESAKRVVVDNTIDLPSTSSTLHAGQGACNLYGAGSNPKQKGLPLYHEISAARCLTVPQAYKGIQYDIHRGPIRISHEIVFFVTIIDRIGNMHNLQLCAPIFVLPKIDGKRTILPRYEEADTDPLLETSGGTVPRRDRNILSQYVLVDMEEGGAEATVAPTDSGIFDACPLELDGFTPADDDSPPPSYPGAVSTIERTVISSSAAATTTTAISRDEPVRAHRLRKLCSRALLRTPHTQEPSTTSSPSIPPVPSLQRPLQQAELGSPNSVILV
ncbi:hypothetical protein BX070DRAFT_236488 [Coemansia spiralis]|nr:hypothetical protein BX070DRAFT_236488 [Coemansia spiralis]